jgi:hypothetical protein
MSRIQISLPEAALAELREQAAITGEPLSRVAARLVLAGLSTAPASAPKKKRAPDLGHSSAWTRTPSRPSWLEPYDDNERRLWKELTWGSVLALHSRYPDALACLPASWWQRTDLYETVCALIVWRHAIDDCATDPREELAFHDWLGVFEQTLRRLPGGAGTRFEPGAAPSGWMR